jgi:hypothetical protein
VIAIHILRSRGRIEVSETEKDSGLASSKNPNGEDDEGEEAWMGVERCEVRETRRRGGVLSPEGVTPRRKSNVRRRKVWK